MTLACAFTFCTREQGTGTWTQVDVLDLKVADAPVHTGRYGGEDYKVTATVTVNERNVMLPVCEEHWHALRTVR